jgi:hypothetical protein
MPRQMKKTPLGWYQYHSKKHYMVRVLCWRFEEKETENKMTEQEYVDYYVHPNDRWKASKE